MLKSMLICNADGMPFFSRNFDEFIEIEPLLLSGLISALGSFGKQLFDKEIATVFFGSPAEQTSSLFVITKDLISIDKKIHFCFFSEGNLNHKILAELSTNLFIEIKNMLSVTHPDFQVINDKVNRIIDTRFKDIEKTVSSK
jgi:hypothetical protein